MRRLGAMVGVVAMLLWAAPPAALADPQGDGVSGDVVGPPAADAPGEATIPLAGIGGPATVAFYIRNDNTTTGLRFPVPPGLLPVAIRAKVELPISLRYGSLTVSQDDRAISRVKLPTDDQADIVIPLRGVEVSGGWADVTLGMNASTFDAYCWNDDAPIRLVDMAATFTGVVGVPTSVGNFLSPVIRRVTIAVPPKPSPAESDAAVQVAASVAWRNGRNTDIAVVPLPPGMTVLDTPPTPLERQIVVKEGGPEGLSLQAAGVPALLISGTGKQLTDQARLLSSDALPYASSAKAVADELPDREVLSDNTTVADVTRSNGLLNSALWPKVVIDLDQTRFGHPLGGIQIHLTGSYTPLARDFGGEVTAAVGGEVLDRWAVDQDGIIDRIVTIPDKMVRRFVTLAVEIRTTGDPGHCGDYLPIALRIDGKSTIRVRTVIPPVPQGFQSFPQALMPTVKFGIGPDAFNDVVRAGQIAAGLQRVSGVPLMTEVDTVEQVLGSGASAVLIAADGWKDPAITLPYNTASGQLTVQGVNERGDSASLTLDPEVKFGSLQTVFDGARSLIVASSNGAPEQLDNLLRYLGNGRWSGLNGRAIISAPNTEPLTVPNPPVIEQQQPATQGQNSFWWVVGGIAAVAGVGALLILLRARRTAGNQQGS